MSDLELIDTLCRRVAEIPGDVDTVVRRHVRAVAPLPGSSPLLWHAWPVSTDSTR
jgi:hypothetical protein